MQSNAMQEKKQGEGENSLNHGLEPTVSRTSLPKSETTKIGKLIITEAKQVQPVPKTKKTIYANPNTGKKEPQKMKKKKKEQRIARTK